MGTCEHGVYDRNRCETCDAVVVARVLRAFPGVCSGEPVPVGVRADTTNIRLLQIACLGRFMTYGDAVPRILARLRDGRVVQVMNADNSRVVQAWLRREMKRVPYPHTDRHVGWATAWGNVIGG